MPLLSAEDREEVLKIYTEMKDGYKTLAAQLAAGAPIGEIKTKLDKIDESLMDFHKKQEALNTRADAIELAMNRARELAQPPKSLGERFVEDAGFVAYAKRSSREAYTVMLKGPLFGQKDITGVSTQWPQMLDFVAPGPRLPYGVRQLIPPGRTTSGAVEFIRETSFTDNAATVAEGAAKPKSDKVFTPITEVVRTIGHYFKISRQTFDDMPFLASQVDNNGVYGVQLAEDNQLLNGTGVAPQITGFMLNAVAAPAPPAGSNLVDAVGMAVFDLAAKGWVPDGTVMNPSDWGNVAMLKNSQGNYLFYNPLVYVQGDRIWGTRFVLSTNMAAGDFLVGGFRSNSQLVDRQDVTVQVAAQNEDDFIKNMLTILVEERIALLISQFAAFEAGVVPTP